MEILNTIGKALFVLLAIMTVVSPLISERRNYSFVWSVWRRFRIVMLLECLSVVILTITVMAMLVRVSGFKYGWTSLFFGGESGNILVRPILEGSKSANIALRLMVPVFFVALTFALPFLAQFEEQVFRKGYDDWGSIAKQSVKFGFVHCFCGVSFAAGIALIIPGLFYGLKYKQALARNMDTLGYWQAESEAVMVSTTYHTMYNMIVTAYLLFSSLIAI